MTNRFLNSEIIDKYKKYLLAEEKSPVTIQKYIHDINMFSAYTNRQEITKEVTISYKKYLEEQHYAVRSINSMIASLNSLFDFMGWVECKVKMLKYQREIYCAEEKELSKAEYLRLLESSKKQPQLNLLLQTICSTGIRISELKFFTVESIYKGEVHVRCKSKIRTVIIPKKLRQLLLNFANSKHITKGPIFVSRNGNPLDRSNIWTQMKRLCKRAGVNSSKVFPHNLRKLFARTFYSNEKDIAKLADILGHGSIDTTRIYIMSTGVEHRKIIERLGLVI